MSKTYHHGDLRCALVTAGMELTRDGGPAALSIREVTRRAGVSPNAAYRHFADRAALLDAVAAQIESSMAAGMVIPPSRGRTPQSRARAQLQAVGEGYINFALAEPGWFAVVFFGSGAERSTPAAPRTSPPYSALTDALDGLVAAGVISSRQRTNAEWQCWSAVHGFAELALHGPLRNMPDAEIHALARRTVRATIVGVATDPG